MSASLDELVEKYVRTWDVRAQVGLVDEVMARGVVDHHPVGEADRVAVRWSATGTHEGDQLGLPPTHRRVRLHGIDILRITDGQVAERWGEFNGLEMMQQLTATSV